MKKLLLLSTVLLCISCAVDDDAVVRATEAQEYINVPKLIAPEVVFNPDKYDNVPYPVHNNLNGLGYQIIETASEWEITYDFLTNNGFFVPNILPPEFIDFDTYTVIYLSAEWDCDACKVWIEDVTEYNDKVEVRIDGDPMGMWYWYLTHNIYIAKIPKTDKPIEVVTL